MKTQILLTILGAAALTAITFNANAGDATLSPRAAGNQARHFSGTYNDPNLINTTGIVIVAPRPAGNQAVAVASTGTETTPAMACAQHMNASPKAIQACADHPTAPMDCCKPVLAAK